MQIHFPWSSNCSKLQIWGDLTNCYRITYFNPFKNILGKVIPYPFFRFDIPLNILLTYTYNGFLLENWGGRKTYLCPNIWHNLNGKVVSKYKNVNLEKISPKNYQLPLLFKRPISISYFHPLFINYWILPSEGSK